MRSAQPEPLVSCCGEVGLAVAAAVLLLLEHVALGVGRDPGVDFAVAVGVGLLDRGALLTTAAALVDLAVEVRVLFLARHLAALVVGEEVGLAVGVAVLLGADLLAALEEAHGFEPAVPVGILFDPLGQLALVKGRHHVRAAVEVAVLLLPRLPALPVFDRDVRLPVGVGIGLGANRLAIRDGRDELEAPVLVLVGLLAHHHAARVDLEEVGLAVGVLVDLLAGRPLLLVEAHHDVGLAVAAGVAALDGLAPVPEAQDRVVAPVARG
ncbi:MAG: hypothetical protein ACYS1E_20780, partial [Planctomycetota bacterium]